jgi:ABC-2 type transport system ATP-binding protein
MSGRRRWSALALAVVVLVGAGVALSVAVTATPALRVSNQFVTGTPEAGGTPVRLDTSLYLPAHTPAPAVLLAHGLGGTKAGMDAQARDLAQHGFVVLTYTARGFGASGGLIHLDALQYEIADGSRLLDYLQSRPEVATRHGAPLLGVAGGSYGGALALMLGATDHRISAVAADITWHSLTDAVFPNDSRDSGAAAGVYKKLWVGYLFSISMRPGATGTSDLSGLLGSGGGVGAASGGGSGSDSAGSAADSAAGTAGCGRFAPDVCAFYQRTGTSTAAAEQSSRALLAQSSPATVISGMKAPTLLTQGEQDSLFPLSEADANARQLAAAGAPVYVRWRAGGHDAAAASDDVNGWQRQFLTYELRGVGSAPAPFVLAQAGAGLSATNGRAVDTTLRAHGGYPGATGPAATITSLPLSGPPQTISAPPAGSPAAITSLPGLGSVLSAASSVGLAGAGGLSVLPGQTAMFVTAPLPAQRLVTGGSTVTLTVAGTGGAATATLFVSLRDLAADGSQGLPANLVAPIAVSLPAGGVARTVTVTLPWIVAQIPSGHRLAVVVSTTDFGYAMPSDPRSYRVAVAGALAVPSVATTTIRAGNVARWPIAAVIAVLVAAGYLLWRLRSVRSGPPVAELADVPVAITDLVKEYGDGFRAVDGVTFRVERGQVLGLLGPNGAGKTTTLRVLMGLIMPTSGSVRVFGEQVVPGAAVLSELGAFVEGPGLLPHLSGRDNLQLYWAASGREPEAAELDTVLEIAGLGASLERKVKTYSHGMQQRLAIAQAMLGLPEVLILDEPTNGLDPPQIAEMREVLHRYAATGRTVIVSSHLLAEVEQTCTHVVVMARGRLVAAGSVTEVAGAGAEQLVVADPEQARSVLAAAGISARAVPARRALEDVFLNLIGERHD